MKKNPLMKKKRPVGVTIFGILLIVTSLWHMKDYFQRLDYYSYLLQPLPEKVILVRYFLSWTGRMLGFASGIGILCLKNTFRKIALFLCYSTICTIYWKHPFSAVVRCTQSYLQYYNALSGRMMLPSSIVQPVALATLISLYIIDLGFAICLIYYFTHPKVKALFTPERQDVP